MSIQEQDLRKLLCITVISLFLSACATYRPVTKSVPTERLGYTSPPDLCLALSGGGLRAGTVSLGVIQQLHEKGVLQNIDLVGATSGGGYAVYGILYNLETGKSLDGLLNEQGEYIAGFDNREFIDESDIVPILTSSFTLGLLFDVFWRIFGRSDVTFNTSLSWAYSERIHHKFSGPTILRPFKDVALSRVTNFTEQKFPYPIFITSASPGTGPADSSHEYSINDQFALSPFWIGSKSAGYQTEFSKYLDLLHAVTASGASSDSPNTQNSVDVPGYKYSSVSMVEVKDQVDVLSDPLKKIAQLGIRMTVGDEKIFLSDGGFIENTSVLPLLRRGCKDIIAVSSRVDPDQTFVEIEILQKLVSAMGGSMEVPETITIHEGRKAKDRQKGSEKGWEMDTHYHPISVELDKRKSTVHLLKLGFVENEDYTSEVSSYKDKNWKAADVKGEICDSTKKLEVSDAPGCGEIEGSLVTKSCSFPYAATFRLCYKPDESRAYRHLGKHMVDSMLDKISASEDGPDWY